MAKAALRNASREYSLADLAKASDTSPRTLRFYIARGLLSGPAKSGRQAYYTAEHLGTVVRIKAQQQRGMTLAEIELKSQARGEKEIEAQAHWIFHLASDVQVQVPGSVSPWRMRQIRRALSRLSAELKNQEEETS